MWCSNSSIIFWRYANVILEAMSRGLIIIASDIGAVNILVSSNNGVLIEDTVSEYSSCNEKFS